MENNIDLILGFFSVFVAVVVGIIFYNHFHKGKRVNLEIVSDLVKTLNKVSDSQQQLEGRLKTIAETQTAGTAAMLKSVDVRLTEVQKEVAENLTGAATKTAHTLGELRQRLTTIDEAQTKIEKLSGSVLSLQDILSNKQARGAFGEIQLNDIVSQALPSDSFSFQMTLSNGKRVDCLLHLPNPPGSISIDSKFPLEAYEALRAANNTVEKARAQQNFRGIVRGHIKAIAERYIIDGETADGALMFIPSEAVYAELHSNFPEVIREGFAARVWIVSPTTCMATLNTMRSILKDARMREQAGHIRTELGMLQKDVERLELRASNLNRHFELASKDAEDIKISAKKASQRAVKLDRFEFEDSLDSKHIQIKKG